jgi:fructose-bisphosphate aldolase, class I
MHLGKAIRLERIFNRNTGKTIIVPLDHGVSIGPIQGLINLREAVNKVAEGGANAVLMHKGLPRCSHRGHGRDVGLIIHLSASTTLSPFPNAKILVGTVEDGIKLGADAVSVHLNLGDESERTCCATWARSPPMRRMGHAASGHGLRPRPQGQIRMGSGHRGALRTSGRRTGADVIKVVYTGDPESFSRP